MAYIDFNMRAPAEAETVPAANSVPTTDAPLSPRARRAARLEQPRTALWLVGGIACTVIALIYALAFAAISEPLTAAIVTIVLLLPAASLFGGDGRRKH